MTIQEEIIYNTINKSRSILIESMTKTMILSAGELGVSSPINVDLKFLFRTSIGKIFLFTFLNYSSQNFPKIFQIFYAYFLIKDEYFASKILVFECILRIVFEFSRKILFPKNEFKIEFIW